MVTVYIFGTGRYAEQLDILFQGTALAVAGFVNYVPEPELEPDPLATPPVLTGLEEEDQGPPPDPARLAPRLIEPDDLAGRDYDYLLIAEADPAQAQCAALNLGVSPEKILVADWHRITLQLLANPLPGLEISVKTLPIAEPRQWTQRFAVLPGVGTPGAQSVPEALLAPDFTGDVDGLRVLVVDPLDGAFAFDMEARGAAEVVALDLAPRDASALLFAMRLRGSDVRYVCERPENLTPEEFGRFDLLLLFDLPLKVSDPLGALKALSGLLDVGGRLFFAGSFLEDMAHMDPYLASFAPKIHGLEELPLAFHTPASLKGKARTPYPIPNRRCFADWLHASGFTLDGQEAVEGEGIRLGAATKTEHVDPASAADQPPRQRRPKSRTLVAICGFPRSGTSFTLQTLANAPSFGGVQSEQAFDIYSYLLRKLPRQTNNSVLDNTFARITDALPPEMHNLPMLQEHGVTVTATAVAIWRDIRIMGADFLDSIAQANLLPTDDFYVVKRPTTEFYYPKFLEYYCQKSQIFDRLRFVVTVRHPLETWMSGCVKFAWWNKSQAFGDRLIDSWLTFMEDAMEYGGAVFIDYRKLSTEPQRVFDSVAAALDAPRIKSAQFRPSTFRAVDVRTDAERLRAIDAMLARIPFVC